MTVDARDHTRWSLLRDHGAVERSIEFVRVRQAGDDAVVAARFEDRAGRARRATVELLDAAGDVLVAGPVWPAPTR